MRMVYRIRTNTVTLPRTFSNRERFLMTKEEAKRRCEASWWGCGAPRYHTTVMETTDLRAAFMTYQKIKESLTWCEFDEEKTIIDEVILDRAEEREDGHRSHWDVIDQATAMPVFEYYAAGGDYEDIQGPDREEIIKKAEAAGEKYIIKYRIRDGAPLNTERVYL